MFDRALRAARIDKHGQISKQEEAHVCIPWSMGMIVPLANMQPVGVKDFAGWFFVGWNAMQKFKGRIAQAEESKKKGKATQVPK